MDEDVEAIVNELRMRGEEVISEIERQGYQARLIRFLPEKGCRACRSADDLRWSVVFVGHRIEQTKEYLYTFALVCIGCLDRGTAEQALVARLVDAAERMN